MPEEFKRIRTWIQEHTHDMVELETLLTSCKALAPENGGTGETEKCAALEKFLIENGITSLEHFDAPDARVPSKRVLTLLQPLKERTTAIQYGYARILT